MNNNEIIADAVACFAALKDSTVPEVAGLARHLENLCGVIADLQSALESHEKRLTEATQRPFDRGDRNAKRAPWAVR